MSGKVGTRPWSSIDQWWCTYVETESVTCVNSSAKTLDVKWVATVAKELDLWWDAYTDLNVVSARLVDRVDGWSTKGRWIELGTWWDAYKKTRVDDIAELDRILAKSDVLWEQRDGPFDSDPLTVDLDQSFRRSRPLTPSKEEDWSDWLAQLLRADSGEFHCELFGDTFDSSPIKVEREAHLSNWSGKDRYADILSLYGSNGISIEVKIGDTNLEKTKDTTSLIEDQHYKQWQHYLLLPEQDLWAVRESFDVEIGAGGNQRIVISSNESDGIAILYWSDVSRALRNILIDENGQTPHWSASAFLFCARIEQNRLGFSPKPIIDKIGSDDENVQQFQPSTVIIGDVEGQSEYLKAFMETNNE